MDTHISWGHCLTIFPLLCLITIATIILIPYVLVIVYADVEGVVVGGVTPDILELKQGKNHIGDA